MLSTWYMAWSEQARQGFALAATVADDPGGKNAAEGLVSSAAEDLCRVAVALARLEPDERRQRVKEIAALLTPPLPRAPDLPPRALRLLATEVDRETGRRWIAAAPLPRPGFEPDPGIKALVRLIAARAAAPPAAGPNGGDR